MGQTSSSTSNAPKTPASTPQRAPNVVDPRSPTKDIERTPIQINGPIVNDENGGSASSVTQEEKPRKQSLRQMMFERKKTNNQTTTTDK